MQRTTSFIVPDITLENVVDDERGRAFLKKFMRNSQNEEPILFLEAVEQYNVLKTDPERYNRAKEIINCFITVNGKHELNLSQVVRMAIMFTYEECTVERCPREFFDDCISFVMLEIKEDAFPRFLRSTECRDFMCDESDSSSNSSVLSDSVSSITSSSVRGFDTESHFSELDFTNLKQWCWSEHVCNTQWKLLKKKRHHETYISKRSVKRDPKSRRMKMWKIVGSLPYPVEDVLNVALSANYRMENDRNLVSAKHVHYHLDLTASKYATTVSYERYKFASFLSEREMYFAGSLKLEVTDEGYKRYLLARKTIDNCTSSESNKDAVRGECFGGYMFEQGNSDNTETIFYEVGWLDIKGRIPLWLANLGIASRGASYQEGLRKSLESYTREKPDSLDTFRLMDTLAYFLTQNNKS